VRSLFSRKLFLVPERFLKLAAEPKWQWIDHVGTRNRVCRASCLLSPVLCLNFFLRVVRGREAICLLLEELSEAGDEAEAGVEPETRCVILLVCLLYFGPF
jgi:hypothetical protein